MSEVFGVYVVTARLGFSKVPPLEEVHKGFAPFVTKAPCVVYVSPSQMTSLFPALTTVRGVIVMVSSSEPSFAQAPSA